MTAIRTPPRRFDDSVEHRRRLADATQRMIARVRAGRVTFVNATTSTTLAIRGFVGASGHVSLTPLDATAQATTFRAAYSDGSITFTHADPGADASYSYVAILSGG